MDKIEKIRTELKRRREDMRSKVEHRPIHRIELLDDLLSFLDTLSKEPDIPEFPETFEICLYDGRTPDNEKCTECSTTCSVRKEELDKSLEEAAEEYTQKMLESWRFDSTGCRPPRESFIAGAEWQASQMLKDAVEGEVYSYMDSLRKCTSILIEGSPEKYGDKVRIIVVKDESK